MHFKVLIIEVILVVGELVILIYAQILFQFFLLLIECDNFNIFILEI